MEERLAKGAKGYRRDMLGYVGWQPGRLSGLTHPVTLWQGEADTWTPPAMAQALAASLPNLRGVRTFPDLSHYSTLQAALAGSMSLARASAFAELMSCSTGNFENFGSPMYRSRSA